MLEFLLVKCCTVFNMFLMIQLLVFGLNNCYIIFCTFILRLSCTISSYVTPIIRSDDHIIATKQATFTNANVHNKTCTEVQSYKIAIF